MITQEEQKVYDVLEMLEIQYARYEHKPIYTIKEANELDIFIAGKHCKNLFLRNRKGNVHFLVILDEAKKVDLKLLTNQLGCKSLSFASKERLDRYLGLKPGAVSPFGLINDTQRSVEVLIDEELVGVNRICFHPNVNTTTISITYQDFQKFIKWTGNKFTYI